MSGLWAARDMKPIGPWRTRRIGPVVTRYRRKRRTDVVAFDAALSNAGKAMLDSSPGRRLVRFVWWLNGKLGGPESTP